jgi:hypothetical protein
MVNLIRALILIVFLVTPALAQTGSPQTPSAMTTEINNNLADNTTNAITPHILRQTLLDMINSMAFSNGAVGSGGLNLYASATGSDTNNNCLASGTPCTLKGACNIRSAIGTILANTAAINLADGTYSSVDGNNALCTQNGNGGNGPILTSIIGDCGTPANVILQVPANDIGVLAQDMAEVSISCLTITGGNGSIGLSGGQFSVVDVNGVHFGAFGTNSAHVSLQQQASYNVLSNCEIVDGGASFHWQMRSNAILSAACTTITANMAFTDFLDTRGAVSINLAAWTLTNSSTVTGQRANLVGPGYLITAAAASVNSVLPGNSSATITSGFQDNAGDNQTSSMPVGGTSCTLTTVSHLTVVNGVVTLCN